MSRKSILSLNFNPDNILQDVFKSEEDKMQLSAVDKILATWEEQASSILPEAILLISLLPFLISLNVKKDFFFSIENDFERLSFLSTTAYTCHETFFYSFDVRHKSIKTFHKKLFLTLSLAVLCDLVLIKFH